MELASNKKNISIWKTHHLQNLQIIFGGKTCVLSICFSSAGGQKNYKQCSKRFVIRFDWLVDGRNASQSLLVTAHKWPDKVTETYKKIDWFKGKSTGNYGLCHEIQNFPVDFPNQSVIPRFLRVFRAFTGWSRFISKECLDVNRSDVQSLLPSNIMVIY